MRIKYRSNGERDLAEFMICNKVLHEYEPVKVPYTLPVTKHNYTPDFCIYCEDGREILIEYKGRHRFGGLDKETRTKMIAVKEQHPELDIRLVFDRPGNKIGKSPKSKTWEQWADEQHYIYAHKTIPLSWLYV